ncbi:MAG: helix-turn-helix transcriptional regulator, partial [Clostridia bacterium]|nr:helix-turn-helix transcriptional regulator [Clostridia bacterium]
MLEENIKMLRKSFSLSQVELAHILGVSKQCVSNWENGYIQPSLDMFIKIAQYFNVSTDYLLGLSKSNPIPTDGL